MPTENDNRHADPAGPKSSSSFLHRMIAPLLQYLQARGILLTIEAREALQHVLGLGIGLAVAVVATFAGWLLLETALVGWLTINLGWSWLKAAGITGGAHILVALVTGLLMRLRLRKIQWFPDTLNELKKDRTWLLKIRRKH